MEWNKIRGNHHSRFLKTKSCLKMPKRSCPFAHSTKELKMHIDIRHVGKEEYKKEVYEKTRNLMMRGAREASKQKETDSIPGKSSGKGKKILGPVFSKKNNREMCSTCKNLVINQDAVSCEFCERKICRYCCRFCVSCENNFCQLCSIVNYEMRDERDFCLNCAK